MVQITSRLAKSQSTHGLRPASNNKRSLYTLAPQGPPERGEECAGLSPYDQDQEPNILGAKYPVHKTEEKGLQFERHRP